MMTKMFPAAAGLLLALSCSFSQQQQQAPNKETQPMKGKVSIVELFTSEGCSSCPSADALMPKLQEQYGDKLIILSFHVDYWDRLGWKDAFSKPEWTRRQNQYAAALRSDNLYTPQAVVNGSAHITGSDRPGLQRLIDEGPGSTAQIELTARSDSSAGKVNVSYGVVLKPGEVINIALVQRHAVTNVRRGENGGRQLQHYNVVRDFRTIERSNGLETFTLPDALSVENFHVVAYVQQSGAMHISAAKETAIL